MFKKLFGKKIAPPAYQPNWHSYLTSMDGLPQSILIDLGLAAIAPVAAYPTRLLLTLPFQTTRADLLPDAATAQALWSIETQIEAALKHLPVLHVVNVTYKRERQMHYYLPDHGAADGFKSALTELAQAHGLRFSVREDPRWVVYLEQFYPSPLQLQSINNQLVIYQLQKSGDSLSLPREVFHWAYFKDQAALARYEDFVLSQGYRVIEKGQTEAGSWKLRFSRVDKIDFAGIDEIVLPLWSQAQEYGGEYDGWETSVEK